MERIEVACYTLCYVDGMAFLPHDGDGVVGGGVPITGLHGDAPSAHFVHLADGDRVTVHWMKDNFVRILFFKIKFKDVCYDKLKGFK